VFQGTRLRQFRHRRQNRVCQVVHRQIRRREKNRHAQDIQSNQKGVQQFRLGPERLHKPRRVQNVFLLGAGLLRRLLAVHVDGQRQEWLHQSAGVQGQEQVPLAAAQHAGVRQGEVRIIWDW
jgi:hypothetical protein